MWKNNFKKEGKKEISKNVQKSQSALDLTEMLGCQFLNLVERLHHHALDLEEEQLASDPNHLAIMRTGIN